MAAPEIKPQPSARPSERPAAQPSAGSEEAQARDEFAILIQSNPDGAMIVLNGTPVGKAPMRLLVHGTLQGFFRDYLTLKARFVATREAETSYTIEEECTPLQKIPGGILFTPHGAQRR
ncbi:MAG: PEGA domain-containing protein [Verrucomicrobiota bacterium]|nr:PEGA domain-containing protein [Verrucomicrobiota bacterium]